MAADRHEADDREIRCRMLGHNVPFHYCRQLPEGHPCKLIVDCWQGHFDVMAYLQANYSPEQIEAFLSPPKPKLTSLVELIQRAQKTQQQQGDSESSGQA